MPSKLISKDQTLVENFNRIHDTNLKKKRILALTFSVTSFFEEIKEENKVFILGLTEFLPSKQLEVELLYSDGFILNLILSKQKKN